MKKKLFRSFIVSLFVSIFFISVSNAELEAGVKYTATSACNISNVDFSVDDVSVFNSYISDSDAFAEDFEAFAGNMAKELNMSHYVVGLETNSKGKQYTYLYIFFFNDVNDVLIRASNSYYNQYIAPETSVYRYKYYRYNSSQTCELLENTSSTSYYNYVNDMPSLDADTVRATCDLKIFTYYNGLSWDGSSVRAAYFDPPVVVVEPEGPEFSTELTDDEIANVVRNFSNSTYWKNRESKFTHFFIQRNELNGNYAVFMVPYNLVKDDSIDWLYIPSGISSSNYKALDYDSYCILWHDGAYIPDIPLSLANLKYKSYLSIDGVNFDYYGEVHVNELDDYRIPMTTPIIYSTFPLNFKTLIGDKVNDIGNTVDSFTEETLYDFSELTNSETGESYVFEEIPIETDPVVSALREIFQELFAFIESLLNAIFDFSEYLLHQFGANAFTLIFAIVIEAFSALVAGISLLVRFAGFILTLVAIPADSSLFNVLVDGSAWGTYFIEGLNFLKGLSWNNLNLWTFFECFVATLEVIWTVRIVRRHYSQVV